MQEQLIFIEALEKEDPADRAAFLDQACAGDVALRQRLERLLSQHQEAGSFLESPATGLFQAVEPSIRSEQAGTIIGPYKLLQQIGEGGMGTVFMAEQTQPVRREVALKIIKLGLDTKQVIARFEAERQALALMDHLNIARVLDAGTTESGRPYFVMELVRGIPITRYCDDNHLNPRERLELFVPVCQAIQHAHQKGIIHRDVKPSNVMITLYDGKPVPKVIDFGVAKAIEQRLTEQTLFTQYGTMVGTLEYMSPEQAEISALGVDTRSDIYSLGVLLYELLTGSTPLTHQRVKEAAFGEVLRMIKEEEPARPSTRLSDSGEALASISAQRHTEPAKLAKLMRGELDWIVMKCLEKDRNRRYETANGFAADVQRYLNHEAVQACPPSAWYRFRKFARRNRSILATFSMIAFALVLGTVVSTWQAIRATEAERLAESRLTTANSNQLAAEKAEDQAMRQLFEARLAQAKAGGLSRQPGQRFDSLAALAEATKLARDLNLSQKNFLELRNAAIACLALPDLRLAKEWPGWPPGSASLDFDDKLERYARGDAQGKVSIRRVTDDTQIACTPAIGLDAWTLLTRDGKFLSVHSGKGLQVWSLVEPEPVQVLNFPAGVALGSDFSLDSRQCVVSHADASITVHDLVSGQKRQLPRGFPGGILAVSPKNQKFAISCNTAVEIRDLDSGKVLATLTHPAPVYNLAWHPDGKMVAVACSNLKVYLWDTTTGKITFTLEGFKNGGTTMAFSHAGDLLATTGWEGKLRLWDSRTGKQLFSAMSGLNAVNGVPRFSPDDRLLSVAVREGKLGLWEIAACHEYRTLVHNSSAATKAYCNPSVHGDGRLLAVGMYGGVGLWELSSGRELNFLNSPGTNFVSFEPKSGSLLTNGSAGLLRWAVKRDLAGPGKMQIGPPHKLSVPGSIFDIACSSNGQVLASGQSQGGVVLHADRPEQPVHLSPHFDARYVSISHDGKLVATGSHSFASVNIWDSESGKLFKQLPGVGWRVAFSPNGKWLGTVSGGYRLWEVGSWKEGPKIGGGEGAAFSPDSTLLAVESGYGAIRLVNPDTGKEYARLEDPNQDRARHITFSPDGTLLIATNDDSRSIHVWDLRVIRDQLARMGLDWDLPAYPPPKHDDQHPLQVEVLLGDLGTMMEAEGNHEQGTNYLKARQWDKAITAYRQVIKLDPKKVKTLNNFAWLLSTCPDTKFRDPKQALELAAKAVQLAPEDGHSWNTLGVAQYQAGEWKTAVGTLTKSNDLLGGDGLSVNAFFLAMTHWKLGNKEEARAWHAKAIQWMDKNKPGDEELLRFRAEAAALLKEKDKKH